MGTADVIPGVSGGTIAFILGIYAQLINAIKSFDRVWLVSILKLDLKTTVYRPHFSFVIPLFIGIGCALMFFTRIVQLPVLLLEYPDQIYGMFFGLITASIVILFREMHVMNRHAILTFLAGLLAGLVIFNLVPVQTPEAGWFIFLAGVLAICAMLLPGISGSFILLILNKYAYIFNAIGYLEFRVIIPFFLGAAVGLAGFSRVLSWLLVNYYQKTIQLILGLLTSSLWVIWPFQERVYETVRDKTRMVTATPYLPMELSHGVFTALIMVLTGFIVVFVVDRLANKQEKSAE